ncbi:MAG: DUF4142 domain-containing protein [Gemmatimonadaceae bacterium]
MKHIRLSVLLGAGALLIATASSAQQRMNGSGIRITKDGGEVLSPTTTPSGVSTTVTAAPLNFSTAFDISAYSPLNEKGITFLMATGDSLEIQLGHLAQSKGSDQRVRDYGTMLVTDHTAHLAKTWEIITDEDVGIEAIPNDNEGARLRELLTWLRNNPASPSWDATFLRAQGQHHQNVIDILNANIKNAHDDDLEEHIEASLTSLAKHRDAAKNTATSMGISVP